MWKPRAADGPDPPSLWRQIPRPFRAAGPAAKISAAMDPSGPSLSPAVPNFLIRSFRREDLPACTQLYRDGLLGGKIAENDTGLDIDDIESAYLNCPGSHFWVAEAPGDPSEIIGMVGVQQHEPSVGEIRRLRVRQDLRRRGIGSALMETALKFCQDQGYLKIALDTFMEREPAVKLFEKFHFRHSRTRNVAGKDVMHFYLDLYQREPGRQRSDA
jgi:ribosomal protein S18 acetylase RimI-like enzyme